MALVLDVSKFPVPFWRKYAMAVRRVGWIASLRSR
jgi:hypothetical protein